MSASRISNIACDDGLTHILARGPFYQQVPRTSVSLSMAHTRKGFCVKTQPFRRTFRESNCCLTYRIPFTVILVSYWWLDI